MKTDFGKLHPEET